MEAEFWLCSNSLLIIYLHTLNGSEKSTVLSISRTKENEDSRHSLQIIFSQDLSLSNTDAVDTNLLHYSLRTLRTRTYNVAGPYVHKGYVSPKGTLV